MINELELLDIIEHRPSNLFLVPDEDLMAFVKDDFYDLSLRRTVLAELVVRWCLSGKTALEKDLSALWGVDGWRRFADWYTVQSVWMRTLPEDSACWNDPEAFNGFSAVLRLRLNGLFSVDGFIPVCREQQGAFLPFELTRNSTGAVWEDGTPVSTQSGVQPWHNSVARALKGTDFTGIRLIVANGPEFSDGLKGDSLMLPVMLAAWRRTGTDFPQYDVLAVLATGAITEDSRLADVEVRAKLDAYKSHFRNCGVFFGPDVPGEIPRNERAYQPIDSGTEVGSIKERLKDALERRNLSRVTRDYAKKRLLRMNNRVDRENHSRWADVARQLEVLRSGMNMRRDFDEWLEYMSLLATAYCHAGMTGDSRRVAQEAIAAAREKGRIAKALRLQLTEAVNAQDFGEMDVFFSMADGLDRELETFDGPEKDDLLMRYHGTLGQAQAWGAVFGREGCTQEMAFQEIGLAVEQAYKLAKDADDAHRDEAESNVAQDLNYVHMMQALFAPDSSGERDAYCDAISQLENLPSENSRRNNRYFLMRQQSLAWYNAWRAGGSVLSSDDRRKGRLPASDAESWLVMSNRCHLGALAAAAQEREEALHSFKEGNAALGLDSCWAPVFASIRMAFLSQAVLSLRSLGLQGEADAYEQDLDEVFRSFGESTLFKAIRAERWKDAVKLGDDPRSLPPFYY